MSEKYVCAGGDDFRIVVKENDPTLTTEYHEFTLDVPISSMIIEPVEDDSLIVTGADGIIRIFSLEDKQHTKTIEDLKPHLRPTNRHPEDKNYYRRMAFTPVTADKLVVCGSNGQAFILDPMDDWNLSDRLHVHENAVDIALTCLSFSKSDANSGRFIAFGDEKGTLSVVDMNTSKVIFQKEVAKNAINDVCFDENSDSIISITTISHAEKSIDISQTLNSLTQPDLSIDAFEDSIPDPKTKKNQLSDSDNDMQLADEEVEQPELPNFDDEDDLITAHEKSVAGTGGDVDLFKSYADETALLEQAEDVKKLSTPEPVIPLGPQVKSDTHPSFQPGSTPASNLDAILCWNQIGVVRSNDGTSAYDKSLDISFHDVNTHHTLHLPNLDSYSLASLSNYAYMLASPCEEEPDAEEYDDPTVLEDLSKASKAKIHLTIFKKTPDMPFLFSNSKSWTLQLPKKVDVECIAVNDKYCCACTSPSNTLHFWSLFGSCSFHPNISLPGKPVSLATTTDGERLLVVYEKTLGIDSVYNLGYLILEKKDSIIPVFSVLIDSHLPLSENDSVNWIGFSIDTNHPYLVVQNSGKLLKLPTCASEPVIECATLQSSRPTFDFYWILYVEEICAEVSAILCKGSHYPAKGESMNQQIVSFHDKSKNLFATENVGKEDKITIQNQYSQLLQVRFYRT